MKRFREIGRHNEVHLKRSWTESHSRHKENRHTNKPYSRHQDKRRRRSRSPARHQTSREGRRRIREIYPSHCDEQRRTGNEGHRPRSDTWKVTPFKNSREENDDLAAKILTVLLDNGGKLKQKELEVCLSAKPLTIRFIPRESFSTFLKVYGNLFDVSDVSNSESEEGEITDAEVAAKSDIQICLKHTSSSQRCSGDCDHLHFCKFKLISDCSFENCKFGHDLKTDHNRRVLQLHSMQFLSLAQVQFLISNLEHRKGVTIPSICTYYNKIKGCIDPKKCPHLHVCAYIAGKCAFQPNCKRSHDIDDDQPKQVLMKYGIYVTSQNKDSLLRLLRRGPLYSQTFSKGQDQDHCEMSSAKTITRCGDKGGDVTKSKKETPIRYWNVLVRFPSILIPKKKKKG